MSCMAQKRMLSRQITETDLFMDMPLSAQALYLHFIMNADDDGFIGNSKTLLRMVGAKDDDFKILIAKDFVLKFDDGISVIRDWHIHNYIKKDRYHQTLYQNEFKQLNVDQNGSYNMEPSWNHSGTKTVPQIIDRLDKNRDSLELDKDNNKGEDLLLFDRFKELNDQEPNSSIKKQIKDWISLLTEAGSTEVGELIMEAMLISHNLGKTDIEFWKVTVGILKNWQSEEILSVEEARKQNEQTNSSQIIPRETLPDWAKEDSSNSNNDTKTIEDGQRLDDFNHKNFEKLIKIYPKVEKLATAYTEVFQMYEIALKEGTTFDDIKQGMIRYKEQIEEDGTSNQYVANIDSWFKNKRWLDKSFKPKPKRSDNAQPDDYYKQFDLGF